jgi:hypothetical protein
MASVGREVAGNDWDAFAVDDGVAQVQAGLLSQGFARTSLGDGMNYHRNHILHALARWAYRTQDRYGKKDQTKLVALAKARPYYYAEQTVTKAMASLGMTWPPSRSPKAPASSRATETAPRR